MADWTPLFEGVTWKRRPVFDLLLQRSEVVARFGLPQHRQLELEGIGLFDAWTIRFPCGLEIALWCFDGATQSVTDRPEFMAVRSNAVDRQHVAFHLGFPHAKRHVDPTWYCGRDEPQTWRVMRTDDNGNDFEVCRVSSSCEAEYLADSYDARRHKQFYWIERSSTEGRP